MRVSHEWLITDISDNFVGILSKISQNISIIVTSLHFLVIQPIYRNWSQVNELEIDINLSLLEICLK